MSNKQTGGCVALGDCMLLVVNADEGLAYSGREVTQPQSKGSGVLELYCFSGNISQYMHS